MNMSQKRFTQAKVVILGGPGVGKTAFAVRYITRRYIGDYDANKEMMYTHKIAAPRDELTLEILDTASLMTEETLEKHLRWGDGFVLLYSVTDRQSFQEATKLKDWLFKVRGQDTPIVLVANKSDLLTARAVTEDEGLGLAGEMDCPKYELSVAEGFQAVNETMEELLCQMKREFVKGLTAAVSGLEKRSRLYNMKKAFKKRIVRSRSDTF
ncbi:ras-related and estrogen-regulated growth inhibitor-like [Haliotis rubra]|uniref:ras-related and estrogen-regulated growth inhibitor-like n=1 Tax=Haliotis rubra TaxID=36100 RepID=UPI001EE56CAC|nr:ras-related and estrogen-regulated growth inhibitor-like [Haliotis rubra]